MSKRTMSTKQQPCLALVPYTPRTPAIIDAEYTITKAPQPTPKPTGRKVGTSELESFVRWHAQPAVEAEYEWDRTVCREIYRLAAKLLARPDFAALVERNPRAAARKLKRRYDRSFDYSITLEG